MWLSYDEYKSFGGELDEQSFLSVIHDIEAKLNYLTYGKIKNLDTIPDAVKLLEVRLVSVFSSNDYDRDTNISSYSNGIESFSYTNTETSGSTAIDKKINALCKEYLWEYPELLYRGRKTW